MLRGFDPFTGYIIVCRCHAFPLQLRQAKIQNLRVTAADNEYVLWLDVPMNDALGVSCVEAIGYLGSDIQQSFQFKGAAQDEISQGLSLQELHGDEGSPVLLAQVVNDTNVGMIQSRSRLRLTLKTAQRLRISGDTLGQKL